MPGSNTRLNHLPPRVAPLIEQFCRSSVINRVTQRSFEVTRGTAAPAAAAVARQQPSSQDGLLDTQVASNYAAEQILVAD